MPVEQCPCGSGSAYGKCCGPLHDGTATADSAEALMRSRYAAYATDRLDYVRATWHPDTVPATLAPTPGLRWLGLKVLATRHGRPGDTHGTVEFVARSKLAGRAHRLHETSRFVFERGRWWYVDGEVEER